MNAAASEFRLTRRVLLALDSSRPTSLALAEAVRLARRLDAELTALFIEDVNLLNIAELPLARHINLLSGGREAVDRLAMEARLRAQAAQSRRAVQMIAERAGLRWSFRIVRGRVAEAVIAAAGDQDLLLIGWTQRGGEQGRLAHVRLRHRPRSRASSLVRQIAMATGRPVMLLRGGEILDRPVALVFDGSPGSTHALNVAAALATLARQRLVVLLAGKADLAELAAALLAETGLKDVEYRTLRDISIEGICDARARADAGIVVLDAESGVLADGDGSPLARFACPVMLTR